MGQLKAETGARVVRYTQITNIPAGVIIVNPLLQVVTITEAAALWERNPLTIRRAIGCGRRPLVARKSPDNERGIWLISVDSLIRRWGHPEKISIN